MSACACGREIPQGGTVTCLRSYCQEAAYWRNVARNARVGSKKRLDAEERARECERKAVRS